jgi:hypothetical protein
MILEVCFTRLPIITRRRGPTVASVVIDPLGKTRVEHGKDDGSDKVLRGDIHNVLLHLSLGLGTAILLVGILCPQCIGEIYKTLMENSSRSAIPMESSLVHQI